MRRWLMSVPAALAIGLAGCVTGPAPGSAEFVAAQVSRAYDCGLPVERQRVMAQLPPQERRPFVEANARQAVKSYNAPRLCDASERQAVRQRLRELAGR